MVGQLAEFCDAGPRRGAVAYREVCALLWPREATCANAIWQADHCQ